MDRIAATRGAIVCFRFDLVQLNRCCTTSDTYRYNYILYMYCTVKTMEQFGTIPKAKQFSSGF